MVPFGLAVARFRSSFFVFLVGFLTAALACFNPQEPKSNLRVVFDFHGDWFVRVLEG